MGCGTVTSEENGVDGGTDAQAAVDSGDITTDAGASDARLLGPCRVTWSLESSGQRDVFTSNFDGSNPQQLTFSADDDTSSAWSPSGERILVSTKIDGVLDVFSITPDGARADNLTKALDDEQGEAQDAAYGWSPDGASIAFNRMFTLWTMAADGSNARPLVNLPSMQGVVWSPDGQQLLTVSTPPNETNADMYLVSATDGVAKPVIVTPTVYESRALFSPDGRKIAYTRSENGNLDVWTINADGTAPVNMTPNTATTNEFIGAWSPDGATLIVSSNREGLVKPFKIPATGGSMARIVTEEPGSTTNGDDWTFAISPGSGRILFTRTLPDRQGSVVGTASVTGNQVRVWATDNPTATAGAWSPGCLP
jgi:Tol biopolymer transport system component